MTSSEPNDDWLRKFTLTRIQDKHGKIWDRYYSKESLQWELIKERHTDMKDTSTIFCRMLDLGLSVCAEIPREHLEGEYNLRKFAELRGYI